MPDSTDTPASVRRLVVARVALAAVAVVVLLASVPTAALADGDPASDVLAAQSIFLPQDGGIPSAQQARLVALLKAARRQGFPIRVALIATPADLGSITQLWRMPRSYSEFLGRELSLVFRGTLLVVMPNGAGIYRDGDAPGSEESSIGRVTDADTGASMGATAITLVQDVAAASGHQLSVGDVSAPRVSGSGAPLGGPVAWLAFIVGAALIALAWTASLRARPPGAARHPETSA